MTRSSTANLYRCEAKSLDGFVQQIATAYAGRARCFLYVTGTVSPRLSPEEHDRRIIQKYDLNISRFTRSRRKAAGIAPVHYIRYRDFWVLLSGWGHVNRFLEFNTQAHPKTGEVTKLYRDLRKEPLKIYFSWRNERLAYSIGHSGGVTKVRIERESYLKLKAYFCDIATKRSREQLARELQTLPFAPWGRVVYQLHCLRRAANRARKVAGAVDGPIPSEVIPRTNERLSVRVFRIATSTGRQGVPSI